MFHVIPLPLPFFGEKSSIRLISVSYFRMKSGDNQFVFFEFSTFSQFECLYSKLCFNYLIVFADSQFPLIVICRPISAWNLDATILTCDQKFGHCDTQTDVLLPNSPTGYLPLFSLSLSYLQHHIIFFIFSDFNSFFPKLFLALP